MIEVGSLSTKNYNLFNNFISNFFFGINYIILFLYIHMY